MRGTHDRSQRIKGERLHANCRQAWACPHAGSD